MDSWSHVVLVPDFAANQQSLYEKLCMDVDWDTRMHSRKTASFGVPYNYSGITYPQIEMPAELQQLADDLQKCLGMAANNCLANWYASGEDKMGFHSDATEYLQEGTGIAIVSLGAERSLTFRSKANKGATKVVVLAPGSLFYMPLELQKDWQHALLPAANVGGRISLTFRRIV